MDLLGYNPETKSWEFIIKLEYCTVPSLTEIHIQNLSILFPEYNDFQLMGW
jgi:hypothetical protein